MRIAASAPEFDAADAGAPASAANCQAETKWRLIERASTDRALSDSDVRIMIAMCSHLNRRPGPDFGRMWPSVGRLASDVGCSARTIHRALRMLEAGGYLVAVKRGGGRREGGPAKTNVYKLGTALPIPTMTEPTTLPILATLPGLAGLSPPPLTRLAALPILARLTLPIQVF